MPIHSMKKEVVLNPDTVVEKVIQIDRVTKVVKGGKRMGFRATVVVGDQQGQVGVASGKAREVPLAIRKAIERAKRNAIKANIIKGTIPYPTDGRMGASRVYMQPARPGTGVIAGGAARIVMEAAGLKDVVAKNKGSKNAINTAKATIDGLAKLMTVEEISAQRGKPVKIYLKQLINLKTVEIAESIDEKERTEIAISK